MKLIPVERKGKFHSLVLYIGVLVFTIAVCSLIMFSGFIVAESLAIENLQIKFFYQWTIIVTAFIIALLGFIIMIIPFLNDRDDIYFTQNSIIFKNIFTNRVDTVGLDEVDGYIKSFVILAKKNSEIIETYHLYLIVKGSIRKRLYNWVYIDTDLSQALEDKGINFIAYDVDDGYSIFKRYFFDIKYLFGLIK